MDINSPEDHDYGDIWPKIYRVVALILVALIFLSLVNTISALFGIQLPIVVLLLSLAIPTICWGLWKVLRNKFLDKE